MQEDYISIAEIEGRTFFAGEFFLETLVYDADSFRITLRAVKGTTGLLVAFTLVEDFRFSEESNLYMHLLETVKGYDKSHVFYENHFLYKVQNSRYIEWLENVSSGWFEIRNEGKYHHFHVRTSNELIDVIAQGYTIRTLDS